MMPEALAATPTYFEDAHVQLYHGDAMELLPSLPAASVQLIIADPPYFKMKRDYLGRKILWDRQWATPEAYLAWLRRLALEWRRILTPNGSLYCFASPTMAASVELMLGECFSVLNSIRWLKEDGWHKKTHKEELRSYLSPWEAILFCEQRDGDATAHQGSGYQAACDGLRGQVFEPIRAYLDGERRRAAIHFEQVRQAVGCASGSGLPSHWFTRSQWMLPTPQHYEALQRLFNTQGRCPAPPFGDYHPHGSPFALWHHAQADDEYLRADYEYLRADYEALRRPFALTAQQPYTDVWDFAPVPAAPGKHPAEKPLPLLRHMIEVSSRPGDLILDPCAGSGSTLEAARQCGRRAMGFESEEASCRLARERLRQPELWESAS